MSSWVDSSIRVRGPLKKFKIGDGFQMSKFSLVLVYFCSKKQIDFSVCLLKSATSLGSEDPLQKFEIG